MEQLLWLRMVKLSDSLKRDTNTHARVVMMRFVLAVVCIWLGINAAGESGFATDTAIRGEAWIKLSLIPSFDSLTGDVLDHPDLDSCVRATLESEGADSLKKAYTKRVGEELSKWYRAFFSNKNDASLLDGLSDCDAITALHIRDTVEQHESHVFNPSDSLWNQQIEYFELLCIDSALDVELGDSSVIVGVFHSQDKDTPEYFPFQWGHPDLIDNVWVNPVEDSATNGNGSLEPWSVNDTINGLCGDFNGIDDDGDNLVDNLLGAVYDSTILARVDSCHGHETKVAGTIAAVANNDIGVLGACPECRVAAVRNTDWEFSLESLISYGLKVISRSYGGDQMDIPLWVDLVNTLRDSGGVYVNSAGNEMEEVFYSDLSHVLFVSGFGLNGLEDSAAFYKLANYGSCVDLTVPYGGWSTKPVDDYGGFAGTSFSAPLISGIYGLMVSYSIHNLAPDSQWTTDSIVSRLKGSSTTIESHWEYGPISHAVGMYGAGYPNAYRAMTRTDDYGFFETDLVSVHLNDSNRQVYDLFEPGDTVDVIYSLRNLSTALDTLIATAWSPQVNLAPVGDTIVGSLAYGATVSDTISTRIPSTATPLERLDLYVVLEDQGVVSDTLLIASKAATWPKHHATYGVDSAFGLSLYELMSRVV